MICKLCFLIRQKYLVLFFNIYYKDIINCNLEFINVLNYLNILMQISIALIYCVPFLVFIKVLGKNVKTTNEIGTKAYELGVIYFTPQRNKEKYKKMDDWWLLDMTDIIWKIKHPVEERVSGKRCVFKFEL